MAFAKLSSENVICSAAQVAGIVGVTPRRVRQLVKERVLRPVRSAEVKTAHFHLAESVQAMIAHEKAVVKAAAKASSNGYDEARAARMRALATIEQIRADEMRGLYYRADDIEFVTVQMLTAFRQRIISIPSRTMHELLGKMDARETYQIVERETNLALQELSEGKWKNSLAARRARAAFLRSHGVEVNGEEPLDD